MRIFVGLTHECPTEEHIEAFPVADDFPITLLVPAPPVSFNRFIAYRIEDENELKRVAPRYYEIWTIKEV